MTYDWVLQYLFFYLVLKIEVSFLTRKGTFKITLALHFGEKFLNALVLISVLLFFFLDREVVVPGNFIEFFSSRSTSKKICFFDSWIFFMKLNLSEGRVKLQISRVKTIWTLRSIAQTPPKFVYTAFMLCNALKSKSCTVLLCNNCPTL